MEAVGDWVRTVAITLILAGVADMLVPDAGLKRQVRLAVGLVVVAVMLSPILRTSPAALAGALDRYWQAPGTGPPAGWAGGATSPGLSGAGGAPYGGGPWGTDATSGQGGGPGSPGYGGPEGGAAEEGRGPSGTAEDRTLAVYLAMLNQRLAVIAETVPGVAKALVEARLAGTGAAGSGALAAIDAEVRPEPGAPGDLAAEVRSLLARETGVAPERVRVTVSGGASPGTSR